jgi:hypothetical protein
MLPNQNAPANRRPRSTVMDNLNINLTHHARGLAVAELCRYADGRFGGLSRPRPIGVLQNISQQSLAIEQTA